MNDENLSVNSENSSFDVEVNSMQSNMFEIKLINNSDYTMNDINTFISSPMTYNKQARALSRMFYNTNGLFSNVIDYSVSIPSLNRIVSIIDDKKIDKSLIVKEDKVIELSSLIGHKSSTRDVMRQLLLEGTYIGILRDTYDTVKPILSGGNVESIEEIEGLNIAEGVMIQPLNLDYCKVIGLSGATQIAAFDMSYFDNYKYGGLLSEIRNFPKDFLKAYNLYKKDSSKRWYQLDINTTVVLKFKANKKEAYGRPYCISAMRDMQFAKEYEDDQYVLIQELASSIYYLELPEGEKKGTCSLKKLQQEAVIRAFEDSVLSNVNGNGKKVTTLTLPPNAKIDRLTKDSSLIKDTLSDENIKKTSTSLGFASSALNASSDSGASYASLQVNIDLIASQLYEVLENISSEYTRVFNYYLFGEKKPSIRFEYLNITSLNNKEVFEQAKEMFTLGAGSRRFMIEASSFNSESYISMMRQEKFEKFDEEFFPHATSYTMSDSADIPNPDGNVGGRPVGDVKDKTSPSSIIAQGKNKNT